MSPAIFLGAHTCIALISFLAAPNGTLVHPALTVISLYPPNSLSMKNELYVHMYAVVHVPGLKFETRSRM